MVYLQQINSTLKENIKIPLNLFYKIVFAFIVILLISLMLFTIPSFSKLSSFFGLCFLFITTGLLFYGNYQEEQINKDFSEFKNIEIENKNGENKEIEIIKLDEKSKIIKANEIIEKSFTKNESEINKNFIA